MTFQVRVAPSAADEMINYLPEPICVACAHFIYEVLAHDPQVGTQLRAPFVGHWSAERGEYRVRYRLDEASRVLDVLDITHSRDPNTRPLLR
jgi:mRNA-degrading endonuclease RelE of RelBE toxin-antitoxin system